MDDLKFVMVGHVDHGKSTLIGRLLYETGSLPEGKLEEVKQACEQLGREIEYAYILDSLREEREQGITIDTAQIFFKTKRRNYVIIDAPGHVEFVKNMMTGASQAEAAVLIVDAQDGVKEQTRRHAYILGMLGIGQVIVAVNKVDLIGYDEKRFNEVVKELEAFLAEIGVKAKEYIPISAKAGDNILKKSENMGWYRGPTFQEALDALECAKKSVEKALRYPVQDVYVMEGKRIFAGRVESGRIREGEEVTVLPEPRKTKIKSIDVWEKKKKEAEAGESIGVTTEDKLFIERGNVLCAGKLPKVADRFDAKVFWMSKAPMQKGERLAVRVATQERECTLDVKKRVNSSTLEELEPGPLQNNEVAEVEIKAEGPVVFESFNETPELGRFVLVRGNDIVAGGIIT
ncbi:MAG: GTP-binding protein [Candidatus Altiarchaeota archaeon]